MLKRFGMKNYMKAKVPMAIDTPLGPSLDKPAVDFKTYKSMISSLLYLTASLPDIMFYVCNFSKSQANPRDPHLTVVKNIFRYLHGTHVICLWYSSKT